MFVFRFAAFAQVGRRAPFRVLPLALVASHCAEPYTASTGNVAVDKSVQSGPGAGSGVLPPPPPPPAGCSAATNGLHPSDDACLLSAAYGVFVSSSAPGGGTGTQAAPFRTIGQAVFALRGSPSHQRNRIFVCAETYTEPTLEVLQDTSMYGYLDCKVLDANGRWTVRSTQRANVTSVSTIAMHAKYTSQSARMEAFEFRAADAGVAGGSSYGLVAEHSAALTFVNTRFIAGRGADGTDGVPPAQLSRDATAQGSAGTAATRCVSRGGVVGAVVGGACATATPPAGGANACGAAGISAGTGGQGGQGGRIEYRAGAFVAAGFPQRVDGAVAPMQNARGGTFKSAFAADGEPGASGASGASALGKWSLTGFQPGDGAVGANGRSGGGGGGGGGGGAPLGLNFVGFAEGEVWVEASGGGGGAGGCPGVAGGRGTGGGASIGVFAVASQVTVEGGEILTLGGGRGGRGTLPSAPNAGGTGGVGTGLSDGTSGGHGGPGGPGGTSSHGSSGPAYNVVWTGTKPQLVGTHMPLGAAATGQSQMVGSENSIVAATPIGDVAAVYTF